MKTKLTIFLLVFLFGIIASTNAQPYSFECTIQNQVVNGTDFNFDIYMQRTGGDSVIYLADSDFSLEFNYLNFNNGSQTTASHVAGDDLAFYGSSIDILSPDGPPNVIKLSLQGPGPGDLNQFDQKVAVISSTAPGTKIASVTIHNITNESGSAGLTWRTSGIQRTQIWTYHRYGSFPTDSITSYGTYTDPADVPLPVELTSFSAKVQGSTVKLEWKSATEVNSYGYEIQKKTSENNWTKVGFVQGAGNSNSPKKYSFVDKNLVGGTKFVYRLKVIDIDGSFEYSDEINVEVKPAKFELLQNYPNPFNPTTNIRFTLPETQNVKLDVYNMLGEKVTTLLDRKMEAGFHSVNFDASQLSNGIYIYRIQAGNFTQVKKMILMK